MTSEDRHAGVRTPGRDEIADRACDLLAEHGGLLTTRQIAEALEENHSSVYNTLSCPCERHGQRFVRMGTAEAHPKSPIFWWLAGVAPPESLPTLQPPKPRALGPKPTGDAAVDRRRARVVAKLAAERDAIDASVLELFDRFWSLTTRDVAAMLSLSLPKTRESLKRLRLKSAGIAGERNRHWFAPRSRSRP